jgi:phospholipid-binding lipoprotein MlaA
MHVWGVPEGAYTYLPVIGPSTSRDTVGLIVDIATNPVRIFVNAPESSYATGAGILGRINDRHEFDSTIDSIYDESADTYAQLRSLYIQNRRFQLRGDDEVDYFDPYFDPNEDPYVQ